MIVSDRENASNLVRGSLIRSVLEVAHIQQPLEERGELGLFELYPGRERLEKGGI